MPMQEPFIFFFNNRYFLLASLVGFEPARQKYIASQKMVNVRQTTDGHRLDGYTKSSPCEPNGSGELIKQRTNGPVNAHMGIERAQKAYFTNFHVTKTIFITLCFLFLWRFHIKSAFDWPIRMFENDGHIHVYIAQGAGADKPLGSFFFLKNINLL